MQHPDEGTIHSWLDNALSAEEAAKLESHVAECPQCAAAVAEARGFIAASSRILTALDNVPRGVLPTTAAPVRRRNFRPLWRAAAAVLVVAGGSLIVLREDRQDVRVPGTVGDGLAVESKAAAAVPDTGMAEGAGVAEPARVTAPASAAIPLSMRRATAPPTPSAAKARVTAERDLSARPAFGEVGGRVGEGIAADAAVLQKAVSKPSANIVVTQDELPPLRVLKTERRIGSRQTVYEISPTDTVTLTEIEPVFLSGVVTTGIASARDLQSKERATRSVAPMRAEPAAAPSPPPVAPARDARQSADTMTASTEAVVMAKTSAAPGQAAALPTATVNTIRWNEAATGKTLTLSGKLSVQQLQEIKRRIEAERAAANKKP